MGMRIALDARTIYRPTRRGTGKNLIDLYTTVARRRRDWHILAYHRNDGELPDVIDEPNIEPRLIEMPGDRIEAWGRWRLPMAAWRDGADVLHCPANHCPTWMPIPTVVTIHDLIPLDMTRGRDGTEIRLFEQSVKSACKRARAIITPSHYTRDRLIEEHGADADRVAVNHWAADRNIDKVGKEQFLRIFTRYGIDRQFVLHFGAPAPRKNTRRVLEAWALIGSKTRSKNQLVIVGLDGKSLNDMRRRVHNLGLTDSVILHGFADEHDLPALLGAARVLAYPSLSEGFGLPILDAWTTDTPVLTSDTTSLPEIAGDAALLVNPTDPRNIAAGMHRLLRDKAMRRQVIMAGRERRDLFCWEKTADRFIDVMQHAVAQEQELRRAA